MGEENQSEDETNEPANRDRTGRGTSDNEAQENTGRPENGAKDEAQGVRDEIEGGHPESGQ
ncbi:hypothetical protein AB0I94_24690 [Streptomyces sp. NPDC050147]|uniref:hypothetical protein n=1 Tax=Streptomyces sp. NPDC050147 TaxID=3155513 RepID=UPI003421E2EA